MRTEAGGERDVQRSMSVFEWCGKGRWDGGGFCGGTAGEFRFDVSGFQTPSFELSTSASTITYSSF